MIPCGYKTGTIKDTSRSNWQYDGPRPLSWSAWYPTLDEPPASQPGAQATILTEAALKPNGTFPVVLLSHGTGGTAESLGWLARHLSRTGYVVIGANHHGNTWGEPYLPHGFVCWWERAKDLSVLLTSLATTGFFADRLNLDKVSAVGFSLGCHTVLTLAGAITSMDTFDDWCRAQNFNASGPREFPDAMDHIPSLAKSSLAFQQSWARQGDNFTDARISSLVAIAPPPPIRSLMPCSIAQITLPVTLLTGGADQEAPFEHGAAWLLWQNAGFSHHDLGQNVGHYTFLDLPPDRSLIGKIDIFTDPASIDRSEIHGKAAAMTHRAIDF